MADNELKAVLERIAKALERMAPQQVKDHSVEGADAFVWQTEPEKLVPIDKINRVKLNLLHGIDQQIETLRGNTKRFSIGFSANNALLWGARGTGKSSLVKAIHDEINQKTPGALVLIEIHREDINTLPKLLNILSKSSRQCLLFCDDLSFEMEDSTFKSLKAVLEGGLRAAQLILFFTPHQIEDI